MSMKEAFETFFEEMKQNNIKELGIAPKAPCDEKRFPTGLFLLDTLDADGYAQWKPKLQDKTVSFSVIENELGFTIHPQIKLYVSTYWFLQLEGNIETECGLVRLGLNAITPYTDIHALLPENFNSEETHYLSDHNYFLIGTYCMINGNDSYLVEVNNDTGEVTAVEVMDKRSVRLAGSIEKLLLNMKGKWNV